MKKNKNRKPLYIGIGDTHGSHREIMMQVAKYQITDTVFIHAGDFGIGFMDEHKEVSNLMVLNKHFCEANNILYVVRGNHDDPRYFNGDYQYSHVKLMPDYSVIEIDKKKILLVGGAVSIDRRPRLADMQQQAIYGRDIQLYWFDERFILKEEFARELEGIEYVVSHTAPKFAWPDNMVNGYAPIVHSFAKNDAKLYTDLDDERNAITKLYNALAENNKIKAWVYGHFHSSKTEEHFGTTYHLLNCNEFKEIY